MNCTIGATTANATTTQSLLNKKKTYMLHFVISDVTIGLANLVGHRPLPLPHHHEVLLPLLLLVRQTTFVALVAAHTYIYSFIITTTYLHLCGFMHRNYIGAVEYNRRLIHTCVHTYIHTNTFITNNMFIHTYIQVGYKK